MNKVSTFLSLGFGVAVTLVSATSHAENPTQSQPTQVQIQVSVQATPGPVAQQAPSAQPTAIAPAQTFDPIVLSSPVTLPQPDPSALRDDTTSSRVGGEIGMAMLATAGGALAGGASGFVIGLAMAGPMGGGWADIILPLIGSMMGGVVGAGTAGPLGTWLYARRHGGHGSMLASYGGALVGGALAIGAFALAENSGLWQSGGGMVLEVAMSAALPALGSVLGYELTSRSHRSSGASRTVVTPIAWGTANGTMVGIAGSF